MQTKSLQTKRALRAALLVLLLGVAAMGKGYAQINYNFAETCPSGQTLYYKIIDADNHFVELTCPTYGWVGYTRPIGDIILPESVYNYSVTKIGNRAFEGCTGLTGSITIPNSVITIGKDAFENCSGFTGSLTIPNSVTSIEGGAFRGCVSITSITIGNSLSIIPGGSGENGYGGCFVGCTSLTSVTIGNSVTTIGDGAFKDCSSLTSVVIPNSVTTIGPRSFSGCSSLTTVTIPNSVTTIQSDAFMGCSSLPSITIPNSVTTIGSGAFRGCTSMTSIAIGNSVNSIGRSVFDNCTSLTSITIPQSVTTIGGGEGSFVSGCTSLTNIHVEAGNPNYASIDGVLFNSSKDEIIAYPPGRMGNYVIPNSVTTIGEDAFWGCTNLTSVTIPNSVTAIEGGAFFGCTGLTSILIPDSVTIIGDVAFMGCTGLTSVIIPNSVTTIENGGDMGGCFAGCTNLSSVTIGNSLNAIGGGCFARCTNLNSITFGNSVATIGRSAFYGCTNLASITIPNSVATIEISAFYGCTGLVSVIIGNSVTSIRYRAFEGCTNLREINFNAKNCVNSDWTGCTGVTTIMVGDSVEVVKENMFSGFENLTTLTIGKYVKSIEGMAFANNPRLNMVYYNVEKDLEAPTNVFDNCPNLTTIHIGADVKEIGSNIFKGCNTVHFVVALGPTPAVLDAGAFSDIVDNSVLMVSCGKRVTYYSVWNMFPFNNIIEDCDTYGINVGAVGSGGTITPSVTEAQMGQEVQITIMPNPGMVLVSIKVVNANDPTQVIPISPSGKAASTYSFTMPPFEVVVMATFKSSGASVDENNSVEVAVYPNPTNGLVKIEAENIKHVSISNILGQIVFDGKVGGDAFEYDFSGQKAGIYLVRIETASGVAVKKVSVTR